MSVCILLLRLLPDLCLLVLLIGELSLVNSSSVNAEDWLLLSRCLLLVLLLTIGVGRRVREDRDLGGEGLELGLEDLAIETRAPLLPTLTLVALSNDLSSSEAGLGWPTNPS